MSDLIGYAVVVALLLQAAWRAPTAFRGQVRERSLWGTFTALGAAWFLRTSAGHWLVEQTGVNELAYLLKHLLTIAGLCALLRYVTAIDAAQAAASTAPSRRVKITSKAQRWAPAGALLAGALMSATFLFALDRSGPEKAHFMERHAGEGGLAVYMGLFYLFSGLIIGLCGYQWGSKARDARGALRVGLGLMGAGMAAGTLYSFIRLVYTFINAAVPVPADTAALQETITDSLLYLCFLLWTLGAIAPAAQAVSTRYRTIAHTIRLHRLWADLTLVNPDLVAYPPSRLLAGRPGATLLNTARDVLSRQMSPAFRLGRYITEIRDAILELRRRAPEHLYASALQAAERAGHQGQDAETVAQAYWLRAALARIDRPPHQPVDFPADIGERLDDERAWLLKVAAAYRATPRATALSLLSDAPQLA
ncbi:MAB_1171c family putative transporter [Streptomyces sp. NPDC020800]|uniref:MAB_1171c family putative transporter n=1 Tax=Streptomyces sp. NPDC020800 TaxID=3365092 RepID=UPI00379914E7